ncbi:MAG: UvrD-helicase domain-containing protein, partial [Candidatus Eisenbacteria bacterium]|nr:UvrD-helicase domain-containing protein [Candidatus Eisenbacteria bacterium]
MSEKWTDAQRFAIEVLDRNLLVTAGAGTGKTAVLVEHALQILRTGTHPHRLLVITFTRKAADQLRDRLYKEVAQADYPVLRAVLPLLPRAYISTIHSFCSRLLRESAVTAGIDPGFHLLDETARDLLLSETIREVVDRRYEDEHGALFARLADLCPARDDGIHGLLQKLLHTVRASEDPGAVLDLYGRGDPVYYRGLYRGLAVGDLEWIRRTGRELAEQLRNEAKLTPKSIELQEAAAGLAALPEPDDSFEDLWRLRDVLLSTGCAVAEAGWKARLPNTRNLSPAAKDKKEAFKRAIEKSAFAWLPAAPADLLEQEKKIARFSALLSDVLREIMKQYDCVKTRRGILDFADLELRAARLLDDERRMGLDPARRFDHVLVDEFQDINPLQARIINRLTRGRIQFLVGDLKQCIYQFRQSAPEIFSRLIEENTSIQINDSFRSRPPVLDFVNTLFSHLFNKTTLGAPWKGQALNPGIRYERLGIHPPGESSAGPPENPPEDPLVELHMIVPPPRGEAQNEGVNGDKEDPPIRPRSGPEREALLIARRIKELVNLERRRIWDPEKKIWRETRWGDIAVLMRSPGTGWGQTFLKIFRREGIPAIVGRGAGFFQTDEIDTALNLIRTLDNTLNDIPLAATLRSPSFGWEDNDLALLRIAFPKARHLWPAMHRLVDGDEKSHSPTNSPRKAMAAKVERKLVGKEGKLPPQARDRLAGLCRVAVMKLRDWRGRLGRDELGIVVAGILQEAGLPAVMGTRSQGRLRQANLQKLVDLVQSYTIDHGHSLTGLLSWLDAVQVEAGELPQTPGAAEEGDTVRILSVHMAKGLEFPVVFVAQLGRRLQGRRDGAP